MPGKKVVRVIRKKGRRIVKKTSNVLPRKDVVQPASLPVNPAMITLEDKHLMTLVSDHRYLQAFPCFQASQAGLKAMGKRCGRCSNKRMQARRKIMQELRSCIAGMSQQQRISMKTMLGAQKVQVMVAMGKAVRPVVF